MDVDRLVRLEYEVDEYLLEMALAMSVPERIAYHEQMMAEVFEIWKKNGIQPLFMRDDATS